jgi:HlyD family secretion protein
MKKILHFAKERRYVTGAAAILIAALAYFWFRGGKTDVALDIVVQRGAITQEVTVTGKTKPTSDIRLAFEKGGRISRVSVKVGARVAAGQVLAELDKTELFAQLAEAEATLQVQQAKLNELKQGSRPEDIQVKQTELKKAEQGLVNEYQTVFDVLNDAYVKADDAVRKQVDDLFTNDEDANPQLVFSVIDSQKEIDAELKRQRSSMELRAWKQELDQLIGHITDGVRIDEDLLHARSHLLLARDFLDKLMDATVNNANLSDATETAYKTNISTARTNVAAALSAVGAQEQVVSSQKLAVARANDELALTLAGSTPEQIAAQEAQAKQAQASVQIIQAQLAKSVIRSPIAGLVTKLDAEPGEIAVPNTPLVTVISEGNLEIEANVPEADVAKIAIGDPVRITLDAYGGDVRFTGHIVFIDPAETVIEGVPTYTTTFEFDQEDPTIKPGLTANLDIVADRRENVLLVPQRSIIYRGGKKIVFVVTSGADTEEREVTTGLRGIDGNIEIASGLAEGERILHSPE